VELFKHGRAAIGSKIFLTDFTRDHKAVMHPTISAGLSNSILP
jgi:hypothetical protein